MRGCRPLSEKDGAIALESTASWQMRSGKTIIGSLSCPTALRKTMIDTTSAATAADLFSR